MISIPPWVQGTAGLFIGGAILNRASSGIARSMKFFRNRLVASIEIVSYDESFVWLQAWLGKRSKTKFRYARTRRDNCDAPVKIITYPGGAGTLKYNGVRLIAWVGRESVQGTFEYRQSITFQGIGLTHDLFVKILEEAKEEFDATAGKYQMVFSSSSSRIGGWDRREGIPIRRRESVVLAGGLFDEILDDARLFFSREDWYNSIGIPYRRGYIFGGDPGNGKTSMIRAIAGELRAPIYYLTLKSVTSDDDLVAQLCNVPNKAIVVLEDGDCFIKTRTDNVAGQSGISFGGLLNAIDGIMSGVGRLFIMTTNHYDKLDAALIRPSRFDRTWKIKNPAFEQAMEIAFRIVQNHDKARLIAMRCMAENQSAAWVQAEALSSPGEIASFHNHRNKELISAP